MRTNAAAILLGAGSLEALQSMKTTDSFWIQVASLLEWKNGSKSETSNYLNTCEKRRRTSSNTEPFDFKRCFSVNCENDIEKLCTNLKISQKYSENLERQRCGEVLGSRQVLQKKMLTFSLETPAWWKRSKSIPKELTEQHPNFNRDQSRTFCIVQARNHSRNGKNKAVRKTNFDRKQKSAIFELSQNYSSEFFWPQTKLSIWELGVCSSKKIKQFGAQMAGNYFKMETRKPKKA